MCKLLMPGSLTLEKRKSGLGNHYIKPIKVVQSRINKMDFPIDSSSSLSMSTSMSELTIRELQLRLRGKFPKEEQSIITTGWRYVQQRLFHRQLSLNYKSKKLTTPKDYSNSDSNRCDKCSILEFEGNPVTAGQSSKCQSRNCQNHQVYSHHSISNNYYYYKGCYNNCKWRTKMITPRKTNTDSTSSIRITGIRRKIDKDSNFFRAPAFLVSLILWAFLLPMSMDGVHATTTTTSTDITTMEDSDSANDGVYYSTSYMNNNSHRNNCYLTDLGTRVKCDGTSNLTSSLRQIYPPNVNSVRSIEITESTILNLNLSQFYRFPKLENISVTHCKLENIFGPTPPNIISLNLSSNSLKLLDKSIFVPAKKTAYSFAMDNNTLPQLAVIDLSHNHISELPRNIFYLKNLKSLRLFGNQFKCAYVMDKLSEWYVMSDPLILEDADETFCSAVDDVRHFHYSILGVLKAKKDLDEICSRVDKNQCSNCSLHAFQRQPDPGYPISHTSRDGSVISISLALDCSNRSLKTLPKVPLQTWELNVSNNLITDLSPLKDDPMYRNLVGLDAEYNQVNLSSLTGSPFMEKFTYLGLRNNKITTIPTPFLHSIKNVNGHGKTYLGENYIDCDCDTVTEIKPLLIMLHPKQIRDIQFIYCRDAKNSNNAGTLVKDLQYVDVCKKEESSSNEEWLYILIAMEAILILGIVAKVWHDQRTFRKTGILPWFSAKMPRLPCDAMLEGIKDPPSYYANNHQNGKQKDTRSNSNLTVKSDKSSRASSYQGSSV